MKAGGVSKNLAQTQGERVSHFWGNKGSRIVVEVEQRGGSRNPNTNAEVAMPSLMLPAHSGAHTAPVITFTSDFGVQDHYVGTVKAVLLKHCPNAIVVDVTHQLETFSVIGGAYAIAQTAPFNPPGTVNLVVVDPGVGTARDAVAVIAGDQLFVAPNNGVLTLVLGRLALTQMVLAQVDYQAVVIEPERLKQPVLSATFHGRDLFAPVAGQLAARTLRLEDLGRPTKLLQLPELFASQDEEGWRGMVLSVDRFGNVITNLPAALEPGVFALGRVRLRKTARTFGDVAPGELFAYRGSSGYWEVARREDHAARHCEVQTGSPVRLLAGR